MESSLTVDVSTSALENWHNAKRFGSLSTNVATTMQALCGRREEKRGGHVGLIGGGEVLGAKGRHPYAFHATFRGYISGKKWAIFTR